VMTPPTPAGFRRSRYTGSGSEPGSARRSRGARSWVSRDTDRAGGPTRRTRRSGAGVSVDGSE
jgi:hypothetical protein